MGSRLNIPAPFIIILRGDKAIEACGRLEESVGLWGRLDEQFSVMLGRRQGESTDELKKWKKLSGNNPVSGNERPYQNRHRWVGRKF